MKKFLIIFVALMVLAVTLVSCTPTQGDTDDTTVEVAGSDVTSEEVDATVFDDTSVVDDTTVEDFTVVDTTEDTVPVSDTIVDSDTVIE